jgi:SPP1 family holin
MDKGTAVRTILMLLAWTNTFLVSKGYQALPIVSEMEVTLVLTLIISFYAWFKNNYITKKGKKQKEVIDKYGLK